MVGLFAKKLAAVLAGDFWRGIRLADEREVE
jgi:hypothetical protein